MLLIRSFGRLASSVTATTISTAAKVSSVSSSLSTSSVSQSKTKQSENLLTIHDSCLKQLKQVLEKPQQEFLRIHVETGGCSGFSYSFDIETNDSIDPNEDIVIQRDSFRVIINKHILPYMKGSSIEYKESLVKSSFHIQNPIAETKCGCGTSFSVDLNKLRQQQQQNDTN